MEYAIDTLRALIKSRLQTDELANPFGDDERGDDGDDEEQRPWRRGWAQNMGVKLLCYQYRTGLCVALF